MSEQRASVEMPKAYDPRAVEGRISDLWDAGGYFRAEIVPDREPFTIVMPPPNVTGELHLGHALTLTVEDTLIRWHRMRGEPTLYLPGVDHAGIATQTVIERELAKEGLSRHDIGREQFLERTWMWVRKYRHIIQQQTKRMGASADWTREVFTMDRGPQLAVRTTFKNLYDEGLIYRGERIINWCPRCMTALSDLEVVHREVQGHLWYVRYPIVGDTGMPLPEAITVATTRPETMIADVAVAVNPDDERYEDKIGRLALLPLIGREIPIIADEAIEASFGTGALKVTPGHDPVDFEIGERHGLPVINGMNLDGTLNDEAGPYAGMDRFEAREGIVRDLDDEGLLERVEDYVHSIGHCQRCDTIVEPLISEQWFVRIKPLAEPALEAVLRGWITFVPERFTKVYTNWMENIRDWCISRQLWWGHRIPVWYCDSCGKMTVAVIDPKRCEHCNSVKIRQDEDVLDTWFSSGLWPHSTLGWPLETPDLDYFYPNSVMETGYDIIFFWVSRMIMLGMHNMRGPETPAGEPDPASIPFRTVYLHGMVRDEKGQKMSKSRGNVLDPLVLVDKYGCDALRFALSVGSSPGNDIKLSDERLEGARNFGNKLWNVSRFVISNLEGRTVAPPLPHDAPSLALEDRWILSRLERLTARVDQLLQAFQMSEAGREIHDFLWGEFADWYIEMAKVRLREGDERPLPVLAHALDQGLRLLHPYMPFITEEAWQNLRPHLEGALAPVLAVAPYPEAGEAWADPAAEAAMERFIEVNRAVRNLRAEKGVEPSRVIPVVLRSDEWRDMLAETAAATATLSRSRVTVQGSAGGQDGRAIVLALGDIDVVVPEEGLFDVEAERQRLERELAEVQEIIRRQEDKLANQQFVSKAPERVVEAEREKLRAAEERLQGIESRLREL